jgi:1-phosphatidylinositol phosphodiesterase
VNGHENIAMEVEEEKADEPRIRGWAYMDFYEDPVESGVVPLLVECNFRGRKLGEEGWIQGMRQ